jgi:hypothetical protein
MLLGLITGHQSVICLSHLLLEDTLERRKDMLYKTSIIPRIPTPATKIINFYSIFPETCFSPLIAQIYTPLRSASPGQAAFARETQGWQKMGNRTISFSICFLDYCLLTCFLHISVQASKSRKSAFFSDIS